MDSSLFWEVLRIPACDSLAFRTRLAERRIALVGQSIKATWESSSVWNHVTLLLLSEIGVCAQLILYTHTHTPTQPLSGASVTEMNTMPFEATQLADVLAGDNDDFSEGLHVQAHGQPEIVQGDPSGMDATPNDADLVPPTQPDPPSPVSKTGNEVNPEHAMSPTTVEMMGNTVWAAH